MQSLEENAKFQHYSREQCSKTM